MCSIPWCECCFISPLSCYQFNSPHQHDNFHNNVNSWSHPNDCEQMPFHHGQFDYGYPNMINQTQRHHPTMDGGCDHWNAKNGLQPPQMQCPPSQQMPKYVRRQCSCLVPLCHDENDLYSESDSVELDADISKKCRRGRNKSRKCRKSKSRPKSKSSMICYPMCYPCTTCSPEICQCCPMCLPCNCMQCCMIPPDKSTTRRSSKYNGRDCTSSSSSSTNSDSSSGSSIFGNYRNQSCNKSNSNTRITTNMSCTCLNPPRVQQRNEKYTKRPKRTKCEIGDNGYIVDPLIKRQKKTDKDNRCKHKQTAKNHRKCK